MSQSLPWREAIITVLKEAKQPMHPAEIADAVAERGLRGGDELGATPAATVGARIYSSLKTEGTASPFLRTGKASFALRSSNHAQAQLIDKQAIEQEEAESKAESTGLVNAFGMFWDRSKVDWTHQPPLLGQQQSNSTVVNFCDQRGVYLLHDMQGVVYVGRVTTQTLGHRLFEHTKDRLSGRWNRFSWFGVYPVQESGVLNTSPDFSKLDIDVVIVTMEAVLIEGLEPRQNRKKGDEFRAVEFLQVEDPKLEKQRSLSIIQQLTAQLISK